jgi:hypothetical protein
MSKVHEEFDHGNPYMIGKTKLLASVAPPSDAPYTI